MAKIGLVTIRYGLDVNGGAEYHCRMLAERLASYHTVEVLTTNVKSIDDPIQNYKIGIDNLNGVTIHRFPVSPIPQITKSAKIARKIRRAIYRIGLSRIAFSIWPVWHFKAEEEYRFLTSHPFYSSRLLNHIASQKDNFDILIFFTYENPLTQIGSLIAPEKTILVPTAHMESMLFRSINSILFSKVRFIAFNTEAEMKMCAKLFQPKMSEHAVVGVGVEIAKPQKQPIILQKLQIKTPYLLYCGRITPVKINNFLAYFIRFKDECNIDLTLVLTGDILMERMRREDIIYTGYVQEEEKITLMQNSLAIVNPSTAESLSLLTLEALTLGKPVIANAKSDVMVEHALKSQGAVVCYDDYKSLKKIIMSTLQHPDKLADITRKGKEYVAKYYNWKVIISKFESIIQKVTN